MFPCKSIVKLFIGEHIKILEVDEGDVPEEVCESAGMIIIEADEKDVLKIKDIVKKLPKSKTGQRQMFRINKKGFNKNSSCFYFLTPKLKETLMCSEPLFSYKVVCSISKKELETQTVSTETDSEQMSTTSVVLFTVFATITVVTVCALILHFDVLHIRVSYCRSLKNWFFDYKINYYRL